jgi:hypothetical protein
MKWRIVLIAAAVAACSETDVYPPPAEPTEAPSTAPAPAPAPAPVEPTLPVVEKPTPPTDIPTPDVPTKRRNHG